ncbi:prolyl oligopeptidase family serine peptidase [Litorilinea aerophila]|nr:alpha/beta hydrolase family protein [Litorilinea aerophila]MCC9077668.1 prolyl oligopeptidase family serine peptidase [Litorilinea aerophila]
MTTRNLSPQQMFIALAREHRPTHAFSAADAEGFQHWKAETLPKVLATLGDPPPPAPPEPELLAEWEERGLRRQRWILNVQRHLAAVLRINWPLDLQPGEQRPAILCCHGHGPFGKEPVMGNRSSPALQENIQRHNYHYGEVMAQAGFVTYAIDWIGFGERNDANKPNARSMHGERRDWCNLYYLHATMLGMTSLSINVAHGKAATDVVASMPGVDPERLGVMGLSGGGTMALWMTLCDERFKATEIICYSDLFEDFGIRDINYCGMQVAPGLFKLVNLPDLQGLIAPRPLLIDIGANDTCFLVDSALRCYRRLAHIYQTAGAAEMLELDLHPGEHGWGGNKSLAFFRRHLG